MKILTLLGVMVVLCHYLNAQLSKPLTIGESLPDLSLSNVYDLPGKSIQLSQLKDKVVVIDFFATWCTSCIAALPELDALQKQLPDKLQVFVVTDEPKNKIAHFLNNSAIGKTINLSFIYDNTFLKKYFPHSGIPHEVVLFQNKVAAITYPEYINTKTVNDLFEHGKIDIPVKTTATEGRSIVTAPRVNGSILKRSLITGYNSSYNYGQGKTYRNDSTKRLYLMNSNIINLYNRAFDAHTFNYRLLLEVNDETKFLRPKGSGKHEWSVQNTYCYDLITHTGVSDKAMQEMMAADLNEYFHLNARIEKRKVNCYALQLIDSSQLLEKDTALKPSLKLQDAEPVKAMINLPLSQFFVVYNTPRFPDKPPPFLLDETGLAGNVSMHLKIDSIFNLDQLAKAVTDYGLKIVSVERELFVLVISDTKNPN